MKKFAFSFALAISALAVHAQFGTAPDFNVTDLDGNTHQLYADILDQGLIAVVDVSATWCGPCWSLHSSHALEDLHEAYGPNGTNQLRVIFYEADANTTMADIEGLTSGLKTIQVSTRSDHKMVLDLQQRPAQHGYRRAHTCNETENGRVVLQANPIKNRGLPLR